jgi:hypothetical protein
MAVKLGQSLDTFDNMSYMNYSFYINIVKKDMEKNTPVEEPEVKPSFVPQITPTKVNLPDHLKLK